MVVDGRKGSAYRRPFSLNSHKVGEIRLTKYEYKFVRVEGKKGFFTINVADSAEYQRIIREYAAEEWRFVQIFAPAVEQLGAACNAYLIFEREVE